MTVSISLSGSVFVCLRAYLWKCTGLLQIFVHVTYDSGLVLLLRTLRISGFMDVVIFEHKLRLLDVAARLRQ